MFAFHLFMREATTCVSFFVYICHLADIERQSANLIENPNMVLDFIFNFDLMNKSNKKYLSKLCKKNGF
jgi:hypothetical protein